MAQDKVETDAQASLKYLQALTVECDDCKGSGRIDDYPNGPDFTCEHCHGTGTVPKYPSLQEHPCRAGPVGGCSIMPGIHTSHPIAVKDINLNQLLMDAAKVGYDLRPRPAWETKDEEPWACIGWYTGLFIEKHEVYTTPIEAVLVALAKAENIEGEKNHE